MCLSVDDEAMGRRAIVANSSYTRVTKGYYSTRREAQRGDCGSSSQCAAFQVAPASESVLTGAAFPPSEQRRA